MTLDYEEDLTFFKAVIEHFGQLGAEMSFEKILEFLDNNPNVVEINWALEQAWQNYLPVSGTMSQQ